MRAAPLTMAMASGASQVACWRDRAVSVTYSRMRTFLRDTLLPTLITGELRAKDAERVITGVSI
jgi:hypothetical protein